MLIEMPYIPQAKREELNDKMKDVLKIAYDLTEGELNFIISNLINYHIEGNDINYSLLNGMIGVLESAKLELYNRMVGLYETQKKIQNGGLYNLDNSMKLANEIDTVGIKIDAYETSNKINIYDKKITFDYKDKVSELKRELDELKQAFRTSILL